MRLTNNQKLRARKIKSWGFHYPKSIVYMADRWNLPLSYALATLELESGRGRNVFGHDNTSSIPNRWKGKRVTLLRYLVYKRNRGSKGQQGVGPMQLTSLFLQDKADRRGGCRKASHNMSVGFEFLYGLTHTFGKWDGARRYNGSGDAARDYANRWLNLQRMYHERLK